MADSVSGRPGTDSYEELILETPHRAGSGPSARARGGIGAGDRGAALRLVVKDPTGAVVPGAMVQVRGAERLDAGH
jgi:hypothetical protein